MEHEIALIQSFVIKERQERYLNLISTKKGRNKFRSYVPHFHDLNPRYCKLNQFLENPLELNVLLKLNGAPNFCYVISEHSIYDQQEMQLVNAIEKLFNSGLSYFLSCLPGKLAYYEGEDSKQRFLLNR